jgi:ABC-type branched-subunit amino acid transport system substrate-binding protein
MAHSGGSWHFCRIRVPNAAEETKPVKIGVNNAIQLQVGRDAIDAVKMAVDEINANGAVLGRKLSTPCSR